MVAELYKMSPMQREWAEKREGMRKRLEAAVAREEAESEQASLPAIACKEGGNRGIDRLRRPVRS